MLPAEKREWCTSAVMCYNPDMEECCGAEVNADANCCAGDCYFALGDYDKALWCYQKVLSEYTAGYVLSAHAQYKTGLAYEKLADTGLIPATEAKKQARLSYERLLSKYPNCKDANTAKTWLAENQNK